MLQEGRSGVFRCVFKMKRGQCFNKIEKAGVLLSSAHHCAVCDISAAPISPPVSVLPLPAVRRSST